MCKKVFVPAHFFLLRVPIWSVGKYGSASDCNNLESSIEVYSKNEQLREAIAIASPALYASLKENPSKKLSHAKSLSHYISRMMIRPTPFGLFSSVSTAIWGDSTTIYFDEHLLRKRARVDMEWLYLFIQKQYMDEKKLLSLPLRTNPLVQLSGERYQLTYLRGTDDKNKESSSHSPSKSIRRTPLIQLILEYAKECITVHQLWLKLKEKLPVLEQERTLGVIQQLFSEQFLVPGLLPSLLNTSPMDLLIPYLSLFPGLKAIIEEIQNYDQMPLGKGEEALLKLQSSMADLVPNKNYLQVDTVYEGKNLKLSKNILEELEKALNLLFKIQSAQKTSSILTTYHAKFLEKYGEYRTVPLLELLDDEKGLGASFENPISATLNPEWEKWLNQEWQDCLFHKKKEWLLTEESLDTFLSLSKQKKIEPPEAPLSLDLLCKVFADSHQNIDLGKFLLVLSDITQEGGSIFGRFLDVLGNETEREISKFFALEEKLEVDSLFVELSCLPQAPRNANVTIRPLLRSYRLDIGGSYQQDGQLGLEDIYVGANSSTFYLTDKTSRFNIITRANHVSNVFYEPLFFKFMRYVTHSQYRSIPPFSWGSLRETAVFLPRVRFGKTILSLATWNIEPKPYLNKPSDFNEWADKWNLPEKFFMVKGDQHLLMGRSSKDDVDEILRKLKKGESLKFVEKIDGAWIKGTEGNHYCEISVPFVKNGEYARQKSLIRVAPYSAIANESRDKFPGSNWLYLKLYMGEEKIDEFLIRYLYNFLEGFRQEGMINNWFIVRYRDPDFHLRLRIHSESFEIIAKILSALDKEFRVWSDQGFMRDVSIAKYEREIERYGGPSLIDAAENLFYCDTLSVSFIIQAILTKEIQCDAVVLHALSIVNFLKDFGLDLNEMAHLLKSSAADESQLKGFRQYKNQLMTLINALQQKGEIAEIEVMNVASKLRLEGVENFCKLAAHLEKDHFNSIINSLLHMHCNRLGCLGQAETKAKLYARHALLATLNKVDVFKHLSYCDPL